MMHITYHRADCCSDCTDFCLRRLTSSQRCSCGPIAAPTAPTSACADCLCARCCAPIAVPTAALPVGLTAAVPAAALLYLPRQRLRPRCSACCCCDRFFMRCLSVLCRCSSCCCTRRCPHYCTCRCTQAVLHWAAAALTPLAAVFGCCCAI